MLDPLSLVPFAVATRGGSVDGLPASRLVSAGLTLLQRSAPLVRALAGRRSAVLAPPGASALVALAASDGRGALVLDPSWPAATIAAHIAAAEVGAVFSTKRLHGQFAAALPATLVWVLLDDSPQRAAVHVGDRQTDVDLGSHFGLELEGHQDVEGSPDECLLVGDADVSAPLDVLSHRTLLDDAGRLQTGLSIRNTDRVYVHVDGDIRRMVTVALATLLAGAELVTSELAASRTVSANGVRER